MPFPLLPLLGAVQAASGIIKDSKLAKEQKSLVSQRTPFKTSQQVYDIVSQTQNAAQTGLDPATLQYLTTGIDNAASATLGVAKRLGANPNDLSAILDQQLEGMFKVGTQNAALKMENFSKYLSAEELLSKNLEAEWASQQGIIKDKLQSVQESRNNANKTINSGLNNIVSGISAMQIMDLYKDKTGALLGADPASLAPVGNAMPQAIKSSDVATTVSRTISGNDLSSAVTPNFSEMMRIIGYDNGVPVYSKNY